LAASATDSAAVENPEQWKITTTENPDQQKIQISGSPLSAENPNWQ